MVDSVLRLLKKNEIFKTKPRWSKSIISILIHKCQNKSTRVNTNQTRVKTNQHESNTNQHESTRTNTSQSTQINTSPTRVNTNQRESIRPKNYHSLSQFQLVKCVNCLIGLNITFSHQLELGLKTNQEQIGEVSRCNRSFRK